MPESKTTISDAEGGLLPGPVRERQAPNMLSQALTPSSKRCRAVATAAGGVVRMLYTTFWRRSCSSVGGANQSESPRGRPAPRGKQLTCPHVPQQCSSRRTPGQWAHPAARSPPPAGCSSRRGKQRRPHKKPGQPWAPGRTWTPQQPAQQRQQRPEGRGRLPGRRRSVRREPRRPGRRSRARQGGGPRLAERDGAPARTRAARAGPPAGRHSRTAACVGRSARLRRNCSTSRPSRPGPETWPVLLEASCRGDRVEGVAEVDTQHDLVQVQGVAVGPLPCDVDRSLSTVGHRHTKLQRPEVAASLSPHGAAQKLADEAPQGFPDPHASWAGREERRQRSALPQPPRRSLRETRWAITSSPCGVAKASRTWSGRSPEGPGALARCGLRTALMTASASNSGTRAGRAGPSAARSGAAAAGCLSRSSAKASRLAGTGAGSVRAAQARASSPSAASEQQRLCLAAKLRSPPAVALRCGRCSANSSQSSTRSPSNHLWHRRLVASAACCLCRAPPRDGATKVQRASMSSSTQA